MGKVCQFEGKHTRSESRSTQQTHRTRQTPISAFDLCQIRGSVTLQSTEPKLSGERCSPFSTRLLTSLCLGLTRGGKMPTADSGQGSWAYGAGHFPWRGIPAPL